MSYNKSSPPEITLDFILDCRRKRSYHKRGKKYVKTDYKKLYMELLEEKEKDFTLLNNFKSIIKEEIKQEPIKKNGTFPSGNSESKLIINTVLDNPVCNISPYNELSTITEIKQEPVENSLSGIPESDFSMNTVLHYSTGNITPYNELSIKTEIKQELVDEAIENILYGNLENDLNMNTVLHYSTCNITPYNELSLKTEIKQEPIAEEIENTVLNKTTTPYKELSINSEIKHEPLDEEIETILCGKPENDISINTVLDNSICNLTPYNEFCVEILNHFQYKCSTPHTTNQNL